MSDQEKFSAWEFEQSFNTTATTAPFQPSPHIRDVGNLIFIGEPYASLTGYETVPNQGQVQVYVREPDGSVIPAGVITNPNVWMEGNSGEDDYFGRAVSVMTNAAGFVHALIVSSSTRTWLYRRSKVSFTYDDYGYQYIWGYADAGGAGSDIFIEELTSLTGTSVAGPLQFFDLNGKYYNSTADFTIPEFDVDQSTGGPTDDSNITKSAFTARQQPQIRAAIETAGGYAWAFRVNPSGITESTVQISQIDYWRYTGDADFGTKERLTYHYYFDNNVHTDPVKSLTFRVPTNGAAHPELISVTKWYDTMYFNIGDNSLYAFNHETGLSAGKIELPEFVIDTINGCEGPKPVIEKQTISSNICAANGNLYFTSYQKTTSDQQRLWRYNLATKQWTHEILPGREQARPRHITNGLDGFIWVTNYNNHSIIKVNDATGEIVATIRINRHPYHMMTNQGKELYVASDAGPHGVTRKFYDPTLQGGLVSNSKGGSVANTTQMWKAVVTTDVTDGQITLVDQTTNEQDPFCAARCDSDDLSKRFDGRFFDDGQGYLWFIAPDAMGRLRKSDKEFKLQFTQTDADSPEEAPELDMIPDNSTIDYSFGGCIASIVTPKLTYEKWNGTALETTTVKPYLIWTTNGTSFNVVRLSAFVRKPKYIHRATGMVAYGDQAYIGD